MSCAAGARRMAPFRALEASNTLYRTDNPTAINVQDITKTADSEVWWSSEVEGLHLDESSPQRWPPGADGLRTGAAGEGEVGAEQSQELFVRAQGDRLGNHRVRVERRGAVAGLAIRP